MYIFLLCVHECLCGGVHGYVHAYACLCMLVWSQWSTPRSFLESSAYVLR